MRVRRLCGLTLVLLAVVVLSSCAFLRRPAPSDGKAQFIALLEYIPGQLAEVQQWPRLIGYPMHYLDVARMRADLGVRRVTGASERKDKLGLITGLKTQGLGFAPIDLTSATAYEEWGFDIADVAQSFYLPIDQTAIIVGTLALSTIDERLLQKGYTASSEGEFIRYSAHDAEWTFFLKSGVLLVGPDESILRALIAQKAGPGSSLAEHPSMVALLGEVQPMWGALLTAAGDLRALRDLALEIMAELPEEMQDALLDVVPHITGEPCEYRWDYAVLAFHNAGGQANLHLMYHFASEDWASEGASALPEQLEQSHTLTNPSRTWADLLSHQQAVARGAVLVLDATTTHNTLLGASLHHEDLGFLPVRCPAGE